MKPCSRRTRLLAKVERGTETPETADDGDGESSSDDGEAVDTDRPRKRRRRRRRKSRAPEATDAEESSEEREPGDPRDGGEPADGEISTLFKYSNSNSDRPRLKTCAIRISGV